MVETANIETLRQRMIDHYVDTFMNQWDHAAAMILAKAGELSVTVTEHFESERQQTREHLTE